MKFFKITILVLLLFVFGCSSVRSFEYQGNVLKTAKYIKKPIKIAVLPINNLTTDINAGIVFRNEVFNYLRSRNYNYLSKDEIDSKLIEEGISDGGQLRFISKNDLRKILDVDYLLYIDLIKAEHVTLGVSEKRELESEFKLFYKNSMIWKWKETVRGGKSIISFIFDFLDDPERALKNSAKDFGEQLIIKGVSEAMLKSSLFQEIDLLIDRSLVRLPKYDIIIENEINNLTYELLDNYIYLKWDLVEYTNINEVQILRKNLNDSSYKVYKKLENLPKEINFYNYLEEDSENISIKIKLISKNGFRSNGRIIDIKLK